MVFSMHTPTGLLNKVWFELCLHFCRRGRENQRELTPQMFAIETDNLGKRYICQIRSEVTKNHQGLSSVDTDSKTVRMYETTTDNCPVKSFVKYLSKRHPKCESLFQRPRDSFNDDDDIWYERRPLGKNKLGNMMSDLSVAAALSKTYTNHCIRATLIATLDQAGYEARHIMTVSGHRNEASIKSFSRDTSTNQKRKMSEAISSIIPVNTCNMHTVTDSNSHDQHVDDALQDDMDEILALTTSQTETMLEEINSYETQSSQEKNDIVLKDISNSAKCTTTCISSQKLCKKKLCTKKFVNVLLHHHRWYFITVR